MRGETSNTFAVVVKSREVSEYGLDPSLATTANWTGKLCSHRGFRRTRFAIAGRYYRFGGLRLPESRTMCIRVRFMVPEHLRFGRGVAETTMQPFWALYLLVASVLLLTLRAGLLSWMKGAWRRRASAGA